jgi:acylphosphatase
MAATIAVRVRISGHVQGVWFRAWTVNIARDLCLDGWVRNRTDGSVEAVFCGPEPQVERMIANCSDGPPDASVSDVIRERIDASEISGQGFRQLATS